VFKSENSRPHRAPTALSHHIALLHVNSVVYHHRTNSTLLTVYLQPLTVYSKSTTLRSSRVIQWRGMLVQQQQLQLACTDVSAASLTARYSFIRPASC